MNATTEVFASVQRNDSEAEALEVGTFAHMPAKVHNVLGAFRVAGYQYVGEKVTAGSLVVWTLRKIDADFNYDTVTVRMWEHAN